MLTDEHEHAMKVAEQAYSAGNLVTCDGYYEFDLDAAAAVIAADRAGLVARIAELESEVEVLADNGCHLDAERAAHAQFRQEVSDVVNGFERYCTVTDTPFPADLFRFILPKPVDPLVEAIREASVSDADDGDASRLRAALAKRGLKLVEVGDAD